MSEKLKGMRELSDKEIQVMNEIADLGNQFRALINTLEIIDSEDLQSDTHWLDVGRTHLQIGVMCLKRAVGKPENF